jgi:hypothetical protein
MDSLDGMIPDASVVKRETYSNATYIANMKKSIDNINDRIERAKKEGRTKTCFCPDHRYEEELKRLYASKGYSFSPTGYIGGVWQLTENICW